MSLKKKLRTRSAFEDVKSNNIVPFDILYCILIRLPLKSLLRFRSVSKSWNVTISDNEFKKTHCDQSKALGRENLLFPMINGDVFEFRDLKNPQITIRKQQFPPKGFGFAKALCSCDGLVLLDYVYKNKIYALWNPYTNEYGTFECPYLDDYNCITPLACGFCYDSSMDEYKVILICKSFYAIGYVKRNYWRKETCVPSKVQGLEARSRECCPGVIVDGCVFWSLDSEINQLVHTNSTIIYFDVKSDELKELPKPYFISENQLFRLTSLTCYVGLYGGLTHSTYLDIWIMKEDQWVFLMKIRCYGLSVCYEFVEDSVLLGCTKDGEIIFQAGKWVQYFLIYGPKGHALYRPVQIFKDSKHYKVPLFCLESLYFPKPKRIVWS